MKNLLFFTLLSVLFVGCSSDDDNDKIELESSNVTITFKDEFQIEAKSDSKITYLSENEYHASVSPSGLITGGRVGETNIMLTNGKDTKTLKVTIKAESNLYPEPNMEFGISKSDLIKKLGTPSNETATAIAYFDYSENAEQAVYLFDSDNKLTNCVVLVKTAQSSNLGVFLGERYVPFAVKDYTIGFINALTAQKASMMVGSSLYNISYWMVMYMPIDNQESASQNVAADLLRKEIDLLFQKQ